MPPMTKDQVIAMLSAMIAVAETLRVIGEMPSGHLYARLMNYVNLQQYYAIIERLKHAGLIEEKSHLLRWVGPSVST